MRRRYVLVSDVHGNLPALQAVLDDANSVGYDQVINLGDHASGPLWPRETLDFLMGQGWLQISGNHDREVSTSDPATHGLSDGYAFRMTADDQRAWLRALPQELRIDQDIQAFHGSPASDTELFLEESAGGRRCLRRLEDLNGALVPTPGSVLLCGHSHVPRCVRLSNGSLVINPGSVGLQAYEEARPESYRMENGSPHARYALLEERKGTWVPTFRLVDYDWDKAAAQARAQEREDWAVALETGFSLTGARKW
jgi:predicted phosphodiesterase